jgi:hypothetical protein
MLRDLTILEGLPQRRPPTDEPRPLGNILTTFLPPSAKSSGGLTP